MSNKAQIFFPYQQKPKQVFLKLHENQTFSIKMCFTKGDKFFPGPLNKNQTVKKMEGKTEKEREGEGEKE